MAEDETPETTPRERRLKKENDELKRRLNEQPDAKLQAEVLSIKQELASLKAYVMGFKGDGSGVEFKANVVSLRFQQDKSGRSATGAGAGLIITLSKNGIPQDYFVPGMREV